MNHFLEAYRQSKNVIYLTTYKDSCFEENYLRVREKEQRIYTDHELRNLPYNATRHQKEWHLRQESMQHFIKHIKTQQFTSILEIGCGNGWLANHVIQNNSAELYALDLNEEELIQAARVFANNRLNFIYADIFADECNAFKHHFDLIYLSASIQYFPNVIFLLKRLFSFLSERGTIHIFDSPFYYEKDKLRAKQRTFEYYQQQGVPEMADSYFHHTWNDLGNFNLKLLYQPSLWQKLIHKRRSPFPWICINKH